MVKRTASHPGFSLLDAWADYDWISGVQVESLEDFTEILVETRNSLYEITAIDGRHREVLIRGGRFFPTKTAAHLVGSSLAGSILKIGGIYPGFNLEIVAAGKRLLTTSVQEIRVYAPRV